MRRVLEDIRGPAAGLAAIAVAGALLGGVLPSGLRADASAAPSLAVWLKPAVGGARGGYIDVTVTASQVEPAEEGGEILRIPLVQSNMETVARHIEGLSAADAKGEVALQRHDDLDEGFSFYRRWTANREIEGPLSVSYRAPVVNRVSTRGTGPPVEWRIEKGAMSGAAGTLLILPAGETEYEVSLGWDLSQLPEGAEAVSSLGRGDQAFAASLPLSALKRSFLMVGAIGQYPEGQKAGGFSAAWMGEPPFDASTLMAWTEELYGAFMEFFGAETAPPYHVFLRHNLVNAGGGVGLYDSFVATFGAHTDVEDLELTLAHEMFHTWAPTLDGPPGLTSWFGEGLAVHYARAFALRAGLISPDAFLEDLNTHAARYYSNALLDTPNEEIPQRFWEETRIRVLPYDRGSFYFAALNERIREASAGSRSLDDLLLELYEREQNGQTLTREDWVALLWETLGADAVAHFEAMMDGALMLPGSSAYGPCFERRRTQWREFELGFDSKTLIQPERIVTGLDPESAAAEAGLREGDEIVSPVALDAVQGDQDALLTLPVRRNGETFDIVYRPRGDWVDGYKWVRGAGQEGADCPF